MKMATIDWVVIGSYFFIALFIGIWASKKAANDTRSFFLAGQEMPWWLLGISMVATTFSTDTPNLVTDLVRQKGVSGNWGWWAFLLTGMLTVFIYAKLWHRSNVLTDIEFYELRYSGKAAAFLRGFRALYLGLVCIIPELMISKFSVPFYFGGTSLLIVVVVMMDTIGQIQSHLFAHQYQDLLKKTDFKGGL